MFQTEHEELLEKEKKKKDTAAMNCKSMACLYLDCCAKKFYSPSQKDTKEGDDDDFALYKELE